MEELCRHLLTLGFGQDVLRLRRIFQSAYEFTNFFDERSRDQAINELVGRFDISRPAVDTICEWLDNDGVGDDNNNDDDEDD